VYITAVNNKYNFQAVAMAESVEAPRPGRVAGEGGGMEGLKFKHQRIDSGGGGRGYIYIVPKEKIKLFLVVHKSEKLTLMPKQKRPRSYNIYNQLSVFAVALTSSKHANVFFFVFFFTGPYFPSQVEECLFLNTIT